MSKPVLITRTVLKHLSDLIKLSSKMFAMLPTTKQNEVYSELKDLYDAINTSLTAEEDTDEYTTGRKGTIPGVGPDWD